MKVLIPGFVRLSDSPYWTWDGGQAAYTAEIGQRVGLDFCNKVVEVTLCPDQMYHNASYTVSLMKHTAANWQVLSEPSQPTALTCTCEHWALMRNGCTCGQMQRERAQK